MLNMLEELNRRTKEKIHHFIVPGRINLIGEHVDYVGGRVMPASISLGIEAFAAKSNNIEICSTNFSNKWEVQDNIDFDIKYNHDNSFMNYVYGALIELKKLFPDKVSKDTGFKLILHSTLPIASGLSSSAAFGLLILDVMCSLYNLEISKKEKVLMHQRVENNFIGLKSGVMDQFGITFGKKNNFVELDTKTLEYKYVPIEGDKYKFVLISSNRPRELADSVYNQRVEELTTVSKIIESEFMNLSKSSKEDLEKITDPILYKRFLHVITEVERTNKIASGELSPEQIGQVLNQCHESLSKNYEVSSDELDYIHDEVNKLPGVFGSRMMGAGFGGCVLALVDNSFNIDSINFGDEYKAKFGHKLEPFNVTIEDGIREI